MSVTRTGGEAPVKILTADDHPLLREALARLIAEIGSPVEVLETDSLRGVEELLEANRDVALVILDVMLPDATGIEAVERVLHPRPELALLVVSAKDDPATARAVLDCGARGFISKRSPTRVLADAIRLVLVGGTYVPPEAVRIAAPAERDEDSSSSDPDTPPSAACVALRLTPRQLDVLALIVRGVPNKLISRALRLADGTMKNHTAAIYRTLNVANRTQAVYAVTRLCRVRPNATIPRGSESSRGARTGGSTMAGPSRTRGEHSCHGLDACVDPVASLFGAFGSPTCEPGS